VSKKVSAFAQLTARGSGAHNAPVNRANGKRVLVLASTSAHRRALLERLGLTFSQAAPQVDESTLPGERPAALAERLARAKARAVAARFPDALVIGSDQVAVVDGSIAGKPGTRDATVAQLEHATGRNATFHTGLCLLDTRDGSEVAEVVDFTVRFRRLTRAQIEAYVERERPYDCAGGFRSEALGIALFEAMQGEDPSALVGLPLIRLTALLAERGVDVLTDATRAVTT
jgi:MAF protein